MEDCETLGVDRINISAMFFQQKGYFLIASKDRVVQRGEPFIIFFVDPFLFGVDCILFRLLLNQFIIPFQQVLSKVIVNVIGGNMEKGAVL